MLTNISVEKALEILLNEYKLMDTIRVSLLDSIDSVLAEDIISDINMPPFDRSPLDGYAFRAQDIKKASKEKPVILEVIDVVSAGHMSNKKIQKGQAMQIMTGAKIPEGADAVIRFEDTDFTEKEVKIYNPLPPQSNICKMGEDIKGGEVVLKKGTIINSAEIGILATLGRSSVQVYRKPRIAILSTGDELVNIDSPLSGSKIRNSNSYTIAAQIIKLGAEPLLLGICNDDIKEINKKLRPALNWADMIITTGGASVGDSDLVKDVFREIGAEMLFWRVRMKPGTPIVVAKYEDKLLYGLSGNPAAAYITFVQFVRPIILKMLGKENYEQIEVESILENDFLKTSRQDRFVRANTYYRDGKFYTKLPQKHSSGIISSLSGTNSLLCITGGTGPYKKGQKVMVKLLDHPEVVR